MHPSLAASGSHRMRPLSLTLIVALLFPTYFVRLGHPYEINDLTDQIAEESSSVQSHFSSFDAKEVNSTSAELELSSNAVTALPHKESPTEVAVSGQTDSESDHLKAILPRIKFSCKNKSEAYYSDADFCDIFHYCKSNGFRYTFMCPNDSFYNNQLMACEQNATHLRICKSKASNSFETTALPLPNTTAESAAEIGDSKATEQPSKSPVLRVQDISPKENSHLTAKFESIRLSSVGAVESKAGTTTTTEAQLSTSTLIPPSLFIEPTLSNVILADEHSTKSPQPISLLPSSTVATFDYSNLTTTKLPIVYPKPLSEKHQKPHKPSNHKETYAYQTKSYIKDVKLHPSMNFIKNSKKQPNFNHILHDLDMSNFELTTDKSNLNYGQSMLKSNHQHAPSLIDFGLSDDKYHPVTLPSKTAVESNKFSLSIHKFFREGLPTHYLKNVPKLFRSMNGMRDYDTMMEFDGEQSMPRKNDHAGDHHDHGHSHSQHHQPTSSMLSIPVLVPINLSQDDYRRRMSASVLKPIVIPLREKGKLIPAYVLQFPGKWRSRYKRSALNGKRLLSLSIKPNLLYQMLPSLLKIKSVTPAAKDNKNQPKALPMPIPPPPLPPGFDLLMAQSAQGAVPIYAMPSGEMIPANMLKYASPYDLNDFTQFIPPFLFAEQNPYQYKPVSFKKGPVYKRPPSRLKIPSLLMTNGSRTNETMMPMGTSTTGLLAVASAPLGQKVSTPPSPLLYGTLPPAHLSAYLENYTPVAYSSSYYSPLLNFGNSILGADPSKFKPLLKKQYSNTRKQKSNQMFNSKEEKATEPVSNYTMPANIYVPDDILDDDFQVETPMVNNSLEQKNVDHKVTNDLGETLRSDESSPMRMFTRLNQSNQLAHRYHRTMKDRLKQNEQTTNKMNAHSSEHEFSTQARINANVFNGTSLKSTTAPTKKNLDESKLDTSSGSSADKTSPLMDEYHSSAVNLTTFLKHLKASLAEIA